MYVWQRCQRKRQQFVGLVGWAFSVLSKECWRHLPSDHSRDLDDEAVNLQTRWLSRPKWSWQSSSGENVRDYPARARASSASLTPPFASCLIKERGGVKEKKVSLSSSALSSLSQLSFKVGLNVLLLLSYLKAHSDVSLLSYGKK